ncbi:MAG: hypothetical protein OEL89_03930, partial [Candidatus Peregrinibacteria bacterium]|nr:hypothetical protein [Candidatus Peregrinibacteria bacterium]
MKQVCEISGEEFEVSDLEISLRKKMGIEGVPTMAPKYRFRELGAFWQHWSLHKRKCDKTGEALVSVFSDKCPYPVWHKDTWIAKTDPAGIEFDENQDVFPQMWEVFQHSPIPHNIGTNTENCEYTDDWWFSKNCYLCHSGYQCEDLKYCYRVIGGSRECQFAVFSFSSELCVDIINSERCFESVYLLNCKNVQNSAFLYDCRNCSDCMFCFNLRNKQYHWGNQPLTKEEFFKKKEAWNLSSRKNYEKAKKFFAEMMQNMAWHRAVEVD